MSGQETLLGEAAPSAANGNPAAVPFSWDMADRFSDVLNRILAYRVVSARDNASVPVDVAAHITLSGGRITYTPTAEQAGRTVTVLLKANNGISDSETALKQSQAR